MYHLSIKVFIMLFAFAYPFCMNGQSVEKIEKKCKGLEYDQRIRIAVGSFKATTNSASGKFAGELSTMLSNALVMTECFQVLTSVKSNAMQDIKEEKEYQKSEDVDPGAKVETGKMLGAQILITGEITEFKEGKEGTTVVGVGISKNVAKVGFILQITNPATRQILFSESINTNAISLGGFSGVRFFGMPAIGSFKTKAMGDAVEKAIIKSVEYIVAQKDKIPAMPDVAGKTALESTLTTMVKIDKTDFSKLGALTTLLKTNPKVKESTKTLSNGSGTINVIHSGSFDELADFISMNAADYDIVGAEKGTIALKSKN